MISASKLLLFQWIGFAFIGICLFNVDNKADCHFNLKPKAAISQPQRCHCEESHQASLSVAQRTGEGFAPSAASALTQRSCVPLAALPSSWKAS